MCESVCNKRRTGRANYKTAGVSAKRINNVGRKGKSYKQEVHSSIL